MARTGLASAKSGFTDLQNHFRNSGSALGEQLAVHIGTLRKLLARSGQEGLQSGAEMAGMAAEQLGKLAGSLLAGFQKGMAGNGAAPDRDNTTGGKGDS